MSKLGFSRRRFGQIHDMHHIQNLTLVIVNPLDLAVIDGVGIDRLSHRFLM